MGLGPMRGLADRQRRELVTMSKCLVLLLLAGLSVEALGQRADPPPGRTADCLPSSSRARQSCAPTTTVVGVEKEITFSLETRAPRLERCTATIEIQYEQRENAVSVEGTIDNQICAASAGELRLAVSIKDKSLELKTLEFVERWQRDDDRPVTFSATYAIGDDVDLVGIRARQSRCTCTDASVEPDAP